MIMVSKRFNQPPFRPDPVGRCTNCGELKKVKVYNGKLKLCAKCVDDLKKEAKNPLTDS